jgi:phage terminase small subunit
MPVLDNSHHEIFAQEIAKGAKQIDAYVAAGFSNNSNGSTRLLEMPHVQERIKELKEHAAELAEVSIANVLIELKRIAFANQADYFDFSGRDPVLDLKNISRKQSAAIQEITIEEYTVGKGENAREAIRTKFKLYDKNTALLNLGKHLSMFTEKVEVTGKDGKDLPATVIVLPSNGRE